MVVVGSALSFLSNGLGLGAAAIAALLLAGWLAWFVGGLLVQDAKD